MKSSFNAYLLSDGRVVRKTVWDQLWHVLYWVAGSGRVRVRGTWDRISARQAKRLRFKFNAVPCRIWI